MDFLLSVYNQVVEILRESPLYIRIYNEYL